MRLLRHIIKDVLLTLLLGTALDAAAQQDPGFAHYWELEPQYNPATVGRSDQMTINASYQTHAVGYKDAGGTMYAGADMAFQLGKTRHGVGVVFQNDQIGLFSHKRFSAQYAYHFNLFGGRMSIGVEGDMLQEGIEGSKAVFPEGTDDAFPSTDINGSQLGFSAGIYYAHKRWHAGFGVMHIMAPTILIGETNEFSLKRQYNFTAGYNIKLRNPLLTIVPTTLVRYDGTELRADITARLIYTHEKKRLYCGVGYSPERSATFYVGGSFHGIDVGYAYEAFTSGIGLGAGQHELVVSYRLPINMEKKGRNLHKSVRYL